MMLLAAPHAARADVIFTNFTGQNFSYDSLSGNPIGYVAGNSVAQGEAFTPTATYTLTSIELALSIGLGSDGSGGSMTTAPITVALMSDNGGLPSTTTSPLASFIIPVGQPLPPVGVPTTPLSFTQAPNAPAVFLNAGTQYWVTVSAGLSTDGIGWNLSTLGIPNNNAYSNDGGSTWNTGNSIDGAFEVDGTLVGVGPQISTPEPGSWSLMASGGFALLFASVFSRSRRNRLALESCRA